MVTLLITSVLLLGLFAIAIYFWQKPADQSQPLELPRPAQTRGLFEDDSTHTQSEALAGNTEALRSTLLARASAGDKDALLEARKFADNSFYDEILSTLLSQTETPAQLLSLVTHVTRHDLRINEALAQAIVADWRGTPDRSSTAKMLHLSALSDDPRVYQMAIDSAMQAWRSGKLRDISATELQAILDGEFWILSARARGSGAGFVLKRTLASARRDLQASNDA